MRKPIATKTCDTCNGKGFMPDIKTATKAAQYIVTRKQCGLSLRQAAKKMGISATYLSELENGTRPWSAGLLAKLGVAIFVKNSKGSRPRIR